MQVKALLLVAWLGARAEAATCRLANTVVSEAKLDGTRVVVCFDRDPHRRTCWGLDVAGPKWESLPATAMRPLGACNLSNCGEDPPSTTITSSAVVTACAPDGSACHTVATPLALGLDIVTDGALVAVTEEYRITVAGVTSGQVTATLAPWSHPDNQRGWWFRGVQFVAPDRLFVQLGDGTTTFARVFSARTGAVALELPGGFDSRPPVTFGNEIALATAGGTELVFGDLKRLARRSVPLFPSPAPLLALLAATPTAVVAVQDERDGTVAIFDGKTTKLVPGPPGCP
jgi:hypothetical protein